MQKTMPVWALIIGVSALLLFQAGVLYLLGQPPICTCGDIKLWEGMVASIGNSQHVSDWYTPSHVIHGFLFFGLLHLTWPRARMVTKLLAALVLEIGWEIIENTPQVINHYRQQALAVGYTGDSILNSVSDSVAMIVGYVTALRMPVWLSIIVVVTLEAVVLYFIRDGLTLNIINLIYPFEFIAEWQRGG
jgi:Protein of unknown function (DUF2585)